MRPPQDPQQLPAWFLRWWMENDGGDAGLDRLARLLRGRKMDVKVDPGGTTLVHDLGRVPDGVVVWVPVGHSESLIQGNSSPTLRTITVSCTGTTAQRRFLLVVA